MAKCPIYPIDISKDRKIINLDNKKYPWKQDPKGYFLVKIENNLIKCGFVNSKHKMEVEFRAKDADKIIKEIAKRKLVSDFEHMGYIASELQIAQNALLNNLKYVQR